MINLVFWVPALAQGKLRVELLGSGFAGDRVSGVSTFARKLRVSFNSRFRDDQPGVAFVGLGGGFSQGGAIADEFKRALKEHGLKAFHGDDASIQQGSSGDLWPRETSVSWVRRRCVVTLPADPWEEAEEELGARLKAAAAWVNQHHDVEGFCKEMPQRMRDLVCEVKGHRRGK